jgi:hypothetical protein
MQTLNMISNPQAKASVLLRQLEIKAGGRELEPLLDPSNRVAAHSDRAAPTTRSAAKSQPRTEIKIKRLTPFFERGAATD